MFDGVGEYLTGEDCFIDESQHEIRIEYSVI